MIPPRFLSQPTLAVDNLHSRVCRCHRRFSFNQKPERQSVILNTYTTMAPKTDHDEDLDMDTISLLEKPNISRERKYHLNRFWTVLLVASLVLNVVLLSLTVVLGLQSRKFQSKPDAHADAACQDGFLTDLRESCQFICCSRSVSWQFLSPSLTGNSPRARRDSNDSNTLLRRGSTW